MLSGWNVLDFTVVCMGILELTNLGNYTFIRCFRALRPLRAITKIESLRVRSWQGYTGRAYQPCRVESRIGLSAL